MQNVKPRERLRKYREMHQLSYRELAAKTGCGASHLCLIEKGHRTPGRETAVKLKKALGIPVEAW